MSFAPDTPGPTFLCYTPNGRKLITVGLNNAIRVFTTGSDAEPVTIDECSDSNTAVAATVLVPLVVIFSVVVEGLPVFY